MADKTFVQAEKKAQEIFRPGACFNHENKQYMVLESGKPTPNRKKGGESKTDLYILCKDDQGLKKEFKLSIKLTNAAHAVNKITADTFNAIFTDPNSIKKQLIQSLQKKLLHEKLIFTEKFEYPKNSGEYKEGYKLSIGWVPEIEYKNTNVGRDLSIPLNADQKFKNTIISGTYFTEDGDINAKVNNKEIAGSGIANLILELNKNNLEWERQSIDYFVKKITTIESYTKDKHFFLILKLVSFFSRKLRERKLKNKETKYLNQWETRHLIVSINWYVDENKLKADIVYENNNKQTSLDVGKNLRCTLKDLEILFMAFDNKNTLSNFKSKVFDNNLIKTSTPVN